MNTEKTLTYLAILELNDGIIQISFPDFEEALSQANDLSEASRRVNEVLKLTIESRLEDNEPIPTPTQLDKINLKDGQYTALASFKMFEKIKYVKKTLTIPEDLNEVAERRGINFSQLLQNAIRQKLEE